MLEHGSWHLELGHGLLAHDVLPLLDHEILLFLLASLKVILLFGRKGASKAGEYATEGRHNTSGPCRGERPGLGGRSMRDANLRNQEWFTRVANSSDELSQGLKFRIFNLLDTEVGSKEVGLVPIVHLKTSEWTLDLPLGIKVHPPHPVRHNHLANLGSGSFSTTLATSEGQATANGGE
jgi:hypothetical protein